MSGQGGAEVFHFNSAQRLGGGAEHEVELLPGREYVLKHTSGGANGSGFGYIAQGNDAPFGSYLTFRVAAPHEYVERIETAERLFPTRSKIVGISKLEDQGVGFVLRQRYFHAPSTSEVDLRIFLKTSGYLQVHKDQIANDHIEQRTWYHPKTMILLTDVKPDNFKQTDAGIIPVDLIAQRLRPDTAMWRAAVQGTVNEHA